MGIEAEHLVTKKYRIVIDRRHNMAGKSIELLAISVCEKKRVGLRTRGGVDWIQSTRGGFRNRAH